MKRLLALLLAVVLLRVEHTALDITRLEPVELLAVTAEDGLLCIRTDTGSMGEGTDLDSALQDLHSRADGIVFPDTADYLVVDDAGAQLLPQLSRILRPACRVYRGEVGTDLKSVASWLKQHPPEERLLAHIT